MAALMTFSICYNVLSINNSLIIAFLNIGIITHPCQKNERDQERNGTSSLYWCFGQFRKKGGRVCHYV